MKQGIFRHVRFVVAIACFAFAMAAHARDVASRYADPGPALASALAADGSSVFVAGDGEGHYVTRVSPSGQVVWRRRHAGAFGVPVRPVLHVFVVASDTDGARIGGDRACFPLYTLPAREFGLACYDYATGDALPFRVGMPSYISGTIDYAAQVQPDGTALLLQQTPFGSGAEFRRWSRDGVPSAPRPIAAGGVFEPQFGADGRVAFRASASSGEVVVLGSDGSVALRAPESLHGLREVIPRLAPDGDLLVGGVTANGDGQIRVVRIAPDGTVRWSVKIADELLYQTRSSKMRMFNAVFDGDHMYVALETTAGRDYRSQFRAVAAELSAQSGTLRWLSDEAEPDQAAARIAIDAQRRPFLIARDTQRYVIGGLDATTGRATWTEHYSCPGSTSCGIQFALGPDGLLRVLTTAGEGALARSRVDAIANPADRGPGVRADQPGVGGAWYTEYAPGRGLVIDYIASSNTLFAPWFTFLFGASTPGSNLHWYSLQGSPQPGSPTVAMGLFENRDGGFATGPPTTARRVGTATLRFESCSVAHLSFRFDVDYPPYPAQDYLLPNGYHSELSLTRLTTATEPCIAADGSVSGTSAEPRGGFDARQSGSWYDPASSGQGVMLAVDPRGGLFGAWFTYDLPTRPNDELRQHWITVQADVSSATNGTVEAALYRTSAYDLDGGPATATVRVGTATLHFTGCDRLALDYRFDQSADAAGFADVAGTLSLQRLGGCTAAPSTGAK